MSTDYSVGQWTDPDDDWPGVIYPDSCCCNLIYTDPDGRDVVEYWPDFCPVHRDDPTVQVVA